MHGRASWFSSMTVCMSWLPNAGGVMERSRREVARPRACFSHGVCRASCTSSTSIDDPVTDRITCRANLRGLGFKSRVAMGSAPGAGLG